MRISFTLLLLLLLTCYGTHAQTAQRTVSGTLKGADGLALPGVNIVQKGTSNGTTTDANGYYSLTVPIGSTLVFSFIGMQTREVLVTENNFKSETSQQSEKEKPKTKEQVIRSPFVFEDSVKKLPEGVAELSEDGPIYIHDGHIDPAAIIRIRSLGRLGASLRSGQKAPSGGYVIKTNNDPVRRGFGLQFTSSIGTEKITQVPALQNTYAQGRPEAGSYRWRGADAGEIFSWGPLLRTLEFDGNNYDFDNRGRLTTAGAGSGKSARSFDANTFFKTGFNTDNNLLFSMPGPNNSAFVADAGRKTRSGVIPNSGYQRNNLSLQLKGAKITNRINGDAMLTFNISKGDLMNRGSNLSSITGAVWRTPASFDNTNALSVRQALSTNKSYRLADGSVRSHAPGISDNPYGLVNELPDNEKWKRFLATTALRYSAKSSFRLTSNTSFDQQWNNVVFGIAPGLSGYTQGKITSRYEKQTFLNTIITPAFHHYYGDYKIDAHISYQFNREERQLNRTDAAGFASGTWNKIYEADEALTTKGTLQRNIHEALFNFQCSRDWFNVRIANRSYFSNTIASGSYINVFPTASLNVNLHQLVYIEPVQEVKIYASLTRTLREAPLIYSNWSHLSTRLDPSAYNQYVESSELYLAAGLLPETERKFETGLNVYASDHLNVDVVYYNNTTEDYIAPVWSVGGFVLQNAARIGNYGTSISGSYTNYNGEADWQISLRWSKYNSKVKKLYSSEEYIPLAGFTSTAAVLAKGNPVGAIYGTTFQRNSSGQVITGNDGYPLVNPSPSMIGNPIPDWNLGLDGFVSFRRFHLSFLFDCRKGGQVWNGTQAALDYLGRSEKTAKQRAISGYIFDGVNINGQVNAVPVNFNDPSQPVDQNRWTRYGFTGVSEEYIENASWLRLSELSLSYVTKIPGSKLREIKFSVVGRNLFLITPYSGVDPASSLFGYTNASGLDLFNTPATRSMTAQITFKI